MGSCQKGRKHMNVLVLDNYDSFTYNLVHMLRALGVSNLDVFRNDKIEIDDVQRYSHILLSPGPGLPEEAGIMPELVKRYSDTKKILGVCLGHQCIGEVFGAKLENLGAPVHGKGIPTKLTDLSDPLFRNLPQNSITGRYHSWVVSRESFPECLRITAEDDQGFIMALRHKTLDVSGVQFHPESILTEYGELIIKNWLD
jgi:anthranilate synthase component 2